ncbi:DUF4270 family protein [Limibacter armeniacum]|uniref:DUF4270 family protein n=1 Tax=Limibacter armeniacum TaxID=466084 RepID=UPI002FE5322E
MNFKRYSIFLLTLASGLFSSCSTDNEENLIGGDLDPSNVVETIYTDTLTVDTRVITTLAPSVSNVSTMLLGSTDDGRLGTTKANFYTELITLVDSLGFQDGAVIDSVSLNLVSTGYLYGDSTSMLNIKLYELADSIRSVDSDGDANVYRSTDSLSQEQLGTFIKETALEYHDDTIRIALDNSFGQRFLDMFANAEDADTLVTNDYLRERFNGLGLVVENVQNSWVGGFVPAVSSSSGITSGSGIFIHYHYNDTLNSTAAIYFGRRFHNIDFQRGTSLAEQPSGLGESIDSDELNNEAFVIAGTGITTVLNFDNIKSIYDAAGGNVLINRADLVMNTVGSTEDGRIPDDRNSSPISSMTLYRFVDNAVDTLATPIGSLFLGDGSSASYSGALSYDPITLTSYLNDRMKSLGKGETVDDDGIILVPASNSVSVNKTIIPDNRSEAAHPLNGLPAKMKLILTYTVFNEATGE